MQLTQWKVEAAVVRRLCERAGPTVEWLGDLGVEYYDQLVYGGDERVPRVHCPIGRGQAVVDVLARHCRDQGVDVALGRRVDRLLVDDGVVMGVAVGDDTITAGTVAKQGMCFHYYGGTQSVTAGNLTIIWDATGVFKFTL
jgi:fumarate reductase flavoprotein subunit